MTVRRSLVLASLAMLVGCKGTPQMSAAQISDTQQKSVAAQVSDSRKTAITRAVERVAPSSAIAPITPLRKRVMPSSGSEPAPRNSKSVRSMSGNSQASGPSSTNGWRMTLPTFMSDALPRLFGSLQVMPSSLLIE